MLIGQNFSPAISAAEMLNAILPYNTWHFGGGQAIALFLHRITPARQTLDYGKSKLAIGYGETTAVAMPWPRSPSPGSNIATLRTRGSVRPCQTSPSPSG